MNGLSDLAEMLFMTNKSKLYSLVYKLLTLTLILLVATVTTERFLQSLNSGQKLEVWN